jgi:hypothetical protein
MSIVQPDPDSKATPTDADREQAELVVERSAYRGQKVLAKNIAQALADQRARYEAVADWLDEFSEQEDFEWQRSGDLQRIGARDAYDVAVSRIRSVSA